MKIVRTPDERFVEPPDLPFAPHYVEVAGIGHVAGTERQLHTTIEGAGHLLQEDSGAELGRLVAGLAQRS